MFDLLQEPFFVELDDFGVNIAEITTSIFWQYFLQEAVIFELELAQVL